uniref:Uncharacterized protein n=1 Tax=Arundo donax TaxID=35708 RepID=A0A0A9AID1_ARUDO
MRLNEYEDIMDQIRQNMGKTRNNNYYSQQPVKI